MKTLTHFLDTPKRSEISALLKPLPISSTTCDSRRLNNTGRSSLMAFRLLRFVFIVRKSILPETVTNMQYWETIADKLHAAGWSWGYCSAVSRDGWRWIVDAHREGRRYIVHSDEPAECISRIGSHVAVIGRVAAESQ